MPYLLPDSQPLHKFHSMIHLRSTPAPSLLTRFIDSQDKPNPFISNFRHCLIIAPRMAGVAMDEAHHSTA